MKIEVKDHNYYDCTVKMQLLRKVLDLHLDVKLSFTITYNIRECSSLFITDCGPSFLTNNVIASPAKLPAWMVFFKRNNKFGNLGCVILELPPPFFATCDAHRHVPIITFLLVTAAAKTALAPP